MSLINEMLRNLETQRPDDPALRTLQREIRSLPQAGGTPGRTWLRVLLLTGLPVLGAGAAWLHVNDQLLPSLGLETPVPPAVVAVPVAAPVPAEPPPVSVPAAEDAGAVPPVIDSLRMADNLAVLPAATASAQLVPDPVAPPLPVPAGARVEPTAPAVVAPPKAAPVAPAAPVKIEKSPSLQTPRDRAEAEARKAEGLLQLGRSTEAVEAWRAALRHDPTLVAARQALLRQLLDGRKVEEAVVVFQDGLDLQPAQIGWAMSLARLQLEQGDLAGADRTLARSQHHAEGHADYAGFQGHLKSRLGAHRLAVGHYQRAVRLAPNEGRWWLGLGLAQEADGRPAEARDAVRRALASGTLSGELTAVAEQHLR